MGHEAIVFGCIEGAFGGLQALNAAVIESLPERGEWPWLARGMFALPSPWPVGTYQTQVIHFGASMKDDLFDSTCWDRWLDKFEDLLRRMYWFQASVHLLTDLNPHRFYQWSATEAATAAMVGMESPRPVGEWSRSLTLLEEVR